MSAFAYFYYYSPDMEFYYANDACYVQNFKTNTKVRIPCSVPDSKTDSGLTRKIAIVNGNCYALISTKLFRLFPDQLEELLQIHVLQRGQSNHKVASFENQLLVCDGFSIKVYMNKFLTNTVIQATFIFQWLDTVVYRQQNGNLYVLKSIYDVSQNQYLFQIEENSEIISSDNGIVIFRHTNNCLTLMDLTQDLPKLYSSKFMFQRTKRAEIGQFGRQFPEQVLKDTLLSDFEGYATRRRQQFIKFHEKYQPTEFTRRLHEIEAKYPCEMINEGQAKLKNLMNYVTISDDVFFGFQKGSCYFRIREKFGWIDTEFPRTMNDDSGQTNVAVVFESDLYYVDKNDLIINNKESVSICQKCCDFSPNFRVAVFQDQLLVSDGKILIYNSAGKSFQETKIRAVHLYQWRNIVLFWDDGQLFVLNSLQNSEKNYPLDNYRCSGDDICCESGLFISESASGQYIYLIDLSDQFKTYTFLKSQYNQLPQGPWVHCFYLLCEYTQFGRQFKDSILKYMIGEVSFAQFVQRRRVLNIQFQQEKPTQFLDFLAEKVKNNEFTDSYEVKTRMSSSDQLYDLRSQHFYVYRPIKQTNLQNIPGQIVVDEDEDFELSVDQGVKKQLSFESHQIMEEGFDKQALLESLVSAIPAFQKELDETRAAIQSIRQQNQEKLQANKTLREQLEKLEQVHTRKKQ